MPSARERGGPMPRRGALLAALLVAFLLVARPAASLSPRAGDAPRRVADVGAPRDRALGAGLLSPRSAVHPEAQRILGSGDAGVGADAVATVFDAGALAALRADAATAAAAAASAAEQQQQQTQTQTQRGSGAGGPTPEAVAPEAAASAAPFDLDRARLLAEMQSIAYCGDRDAVATWTCTRCARIPGFVTTLSHFDAAWDLSGYAGYLPAWGAKVMAFRGTDSASLANWAENMRAWRTDAVYPEPGAPASMRIHSGFNVLWRQSSMAAAFMAAYDRLERLHPGGPVYVLGHSMGAALAHLCALDLRANYGAQDLRVFTFGSPRVGNAAFADFFRGAVGESWRFTHGRDIVPSVPPGIMGFRHVAREVWLVDVEPARSRDGGDPAPTPAPEPRQRIIVCDDSGEDPTCHNAACRLGLCTSVADHLTYLGAHMWGGGEC
ncbi:MAG: Alpha/Beta hydrolase protein [Monoraphidium minutum]|nr:MAG: Alpha/Beta hydrolase protein [Monoraphidium minutum]